MEYNMLDKEKLISELREIHKKLVSLYEDMFSYKYDNDGEFKVYIDNQYSQNSISKKDQESWNQNFCHRASYTLLNKFLFVRICEDKGFMRNPEDYIAGEIGNIHIGKKLSIVGLQKWTNILTNYTFGELINFAFSDMKNSYKNIALYKEDKYEILNPTKEELDFKYINGDQETRKYIFKYEKIIGDIVEKLDTEKFDFSKTDSNVLGDVYEQFMDRDTRKAIGQFYTPDFVIDQILKDTLEEVDVVENPFVRIADISCGSGHFLIMAYDILKEKFKENLIEIKNKYANNTYEIKKNGKVEDISGEKYWINENIHYHLLKHCIYGSDIDSFAVQLTTINLLLKDLDNFTDQLNIIECDSLIIWEEEYDWENLEFELKEEFEIVESNHLNMFGEEETIKTSIIKENYKLKHKNTSDNIVEEVVSKEEAENILITCKFWDTKFDYIVGNPPYMGQKGNKSTFKKFRESNYWEKYYERKQDLYYYFLIRGIDLLKDKGKLGFIIPPYWLTAKATTKLKEYITQTSKLLEIYEFGNKKVFDDAQIDGNVFIFSKDNCEEIPIYINEFNKEKNKFNRYKSKLTNDNLTTDMWNVFIDSNEEDYFKNIDYIALGKIATISPGIQTGSDYVSKSHIERYSLENMQVGEGIYIISENEKKNKFQESDYKYIKPFFKNSDINRYYSSTDTDKYILITNNIEDINTYPNIKSHLLKYKEILDNRYRNYALKKADKEGKWYALYGYRPNTNFDDSKIVTPYRGKLPKFSYVDRPYYGSIDVFYIDLVDNNFSYKFILGILNSELMLFWLDKNCKKKGEVFEFYTEPLSNIPIINVDKKIQTNIIKIVNNIIKNKKTLINFDDYAKIIKKGNIIESVDKIIEEIKSLSEDINKLEIELNEHVYELYSVDDSNKKHIKRYLKSIDKKTIFEDKIQRITYEYIEKLNYYIENLIINTLKTNITDYYIDLDKLVEILMEKLPNLDELMEFLKKGDVTEQSKIIIKNIINSDSYTWNMYRGAKNQNNLNKVFIKYYDGDYYGLSEWSDEIHKHYFLDAIEEYTETDPNEKKAKDILKLFKDLDIEDKKDYLGVIEGKINRVFK